MKAINIQNKRAKFEYNILDKYVAGLQLSGTEIKSIRNSKVNLSDSFCSFKDNELYIIGMYIDEYEFGNYTNHSPKRERKLLLNRYELDKIRKKINWDTEVKLGQGLKMTYDWIYSQMTSGINNDKFTTKY